MRNRKIKLNGLMFAGLIIVISFVYAINIQPVVFANQAVYTPIQSKNNFDNYNDNKFILTKSNNERSNFNKMFLRGFTAISIIKDKCKIYEKIPNFHNFPDTFVKIFELNDLDYLSNICDQAAQH